MPSAQVTITQLPQAGALTGTEAVPIVQNGQTVQTTTGAISTTPVLTQTFITLNQEPTLANSRALSGGVGIGLADGGAQSTLQITLNGASGSLETAGNGIIVKSGGTVTNRSLATSANGIAISDANGVSGNPTFSLSGAVGTINSLSGTGLIGVVGGSTTTSVSITGTANQVDVANGAGPGNPTISIASNAILPGTGSVTVPSGTTGQLPAGSGGQVRYNTTTGRLQGYQSGSWSNIGNGQVDGGAANQIVYQTAPSVTGFAVAPTVTDTFLKWNGTAFEWSAVAGAGTVTSVGLSMPSDFTVTNSPVTAAGTLTATWASQNSNLFLASPNGTSGAPVFRSINAADVPILNQNTTGQAGSVANALTMNNSGSGSASGSTYDGSAPITISYNSVGAPSVSGTNATGTWGIDISGNAATATSATSASSATSATTATNLAGGAAGSIPYQTGSGATSMLATSSGVLVGGTTPSYSTAPSLTGTNFTSIPNGALQNSAVTIGTTAISLGGSSLTLGGLTSVAVTQDPSTALQVATKQYVDTLVASGITYHTPVKYEVPNTTGNLNATYNNGVSGVGATLTNAGTLAAFAPDGPTAQVGDRILVYNQTNQFENGVYEVSTVGSGAVAWVLTRAADADSYGLKDPNALGNGDAFFVTSGNTGAGETYVCNTTGTITFGTTAITFVQVSATQIYSAGTGLTLTGTQFSLTTPVTAILGGTGITGYSTGDLIFANTSTTLDRLTIGTNGYVLASNGTAPGYVAQSTLSVGSATNATNSSNVAVSATSVNATFYPAFVDATSGNQSVEVDSDLTYNPSTNTLTAGTVVATTGIFGGTF